MARERRVRSGFIWPEAWWDDIMLYIARFSLRADRRASAADMPVDKPLKPPLPPPPTPPAAAAAGGPDRSAVVVRKNMCLSLGFRHSSGSMALLTLRLSNEDDEGATTATPGMRRRCS